MSVNLSAFDHNILTLISYNSKALYEYAVEEIYEAGIVLKGTEVKSLRRFKASLGDSHASIDDTEVFIHNLHIPEYTEANRFNHYPKRPRKILLKRTQIKKLIGLTQRKGMTLIPLKFYFNRHNIAKLVLAVAKGKKQYDKRESIKKREVNREIARNMKH